MVFITSKEALVSCSMTTTTLFSTIILLIDNYLGRLLTPLTFHVCITIGTLYYRKLLWTSPIGLPSFVLLVYAFLFFLSMFALAIYCFFSTWLIPNIGFFMFFFTTPIRKSLGECFFNMYTTMAPPLSFFESTNVPIF